MKTALQVYNMMNKIHDHVFDLIALGISNGSFEIRNVCLEDFCGMFQFFNRKFKHTALYMPGEWLNDECLEMHVTICNGFTVCISSPVFNYKVNINHINNN